MVFVDGLLDLVEDSNDLRESSKIAQRILKWTSWNDTLFMGVIHRNEGWKGSEGKMVGHLGSYITRKADFELMMKHNEKSGFTEVIHKPSRMRKFPAFEFTQNKDGYPILNHNETVILPTVAAADEITTLANDLPF